MEKFLKIGGLIIIIGSILFVLYSFLETQKEPPFSPEVALENLRGSEDTMHEVIERNIQSLVEAGGIEGSLDLVSLAFAEKDIFMNSCHALSHSIGHHAPKFFNNDFDKLVEYSNRVCSRGYFHGAEAQLVLSGEDYPERLSELCAAQKRKDSKMTCFHGAGHAFFNQTLDAHKALVLCDGLSDKIDEQYIDDVKDCYEAVFSEIANIAGGYDGETGRHYQGDARFEIVSTRHEDCAGFVERFHIPCGLEVSALGNVGVDKTPEEVGVSLKTCLTDASTKTLSEACFYNIASSYVRHEVERDGDVSFQTWVLDEPKEIRLLYIVAVGHEVAEHLNIGHHINADAFCMNFTEVDEVELCKKQVLSYTPVTPILNNK